MNSTIKQWINDLVARLTDAEDEFVDPDTGDTIPQRGYAHRDEPLPDRTVVGAR